MNTRIQSIARTTALALTLYFGIASQGNAATTDTLVNQDFSSTTFPPASWVDSSHDDWTSGTGWYYSSTGLNGSNGAAVCDMINGSIGMMLTPALNAGEWGYSNDSAFVDFDFFWEYNFTNRDSGSVADNNFLVYLVNSNGSQQVLNLYTTTDYTYSNPSYTALTTLPSDPGAWRHYHIAIPQGYCTNELQVGWQAATTHVGGNAAIDNVVISGTHTNIIGITPTMPLDFGQVVVGKKSGTLSIVVSNPNPTTIHLTNVQVTGGDFSMQYAASSLAPGTIANPTVDSITVYFKPTEGGLSSETLSFNTDADAPQSVSVGLDGIGILVGTINATQTLPDTAIVGMTNCTVDTLWNTGLADVTVTGATFSGVGGSDFAIGDGSLPVTIAPNSFRLINICFTPSTGAARSVNVSFTTLSAGFVDQSAPVTITGVGLTACATPSVTVLFDQTKTLVGTSDKQTVTITNCGDVATFYTAKLTGNSTAYAISGATTSTLVQPGQTASFTIAFTPTDFTQSGAMLTITGGEGVTPMTVQLLGTGGGVSLTAAGGPAILAAENPQNFLVTITNNGNMDWTPGTPVITGANAADFMVTTPMDPVVIPAGGTGSIAMQFTPTSMNQETATLTFPSSAPTPLKGFSYVLTGSMAPTAGVAASGTTNTALTLAQNYPNPFSGISTISFVLPSESLTRLELLDEQGNIVKTIVNEALSGGEHVYTLDANGLANGTYFCALTTDGKQLTRQLAVVR